MDLLFNIVIGAGGALLCWLALEQVLCRALPRLEGYLPRDIVGPGGWFCDTEARCGIFDLLLRKRER